MGRKAKYFTREERLEARRRQRAARYEQPGAREARAIENRKAYERAQLRANTSIELPEAVRKWASTGWVPEKRSIVAWFKAGPQRLSLGKVELGDRELQILSFYLLRYSLDMVDLPPNLEDYWEDLSAALFGYQLRTFMEQEVAQIAVYGAQTKMEFAISLRRRYEDLLGRWETLVELISRLEAQGHRLAELVSIHNARWTAKQVVFAYDDLQAFTQGGGVYLSALNDRHRYFGQLYRSLDSGSLGSDDRWGEVVERALGQEGAVVGENRRATHLR